MDSQGVPRGFPYDSYGFTMDCHWIRPSEARRNLPQRETQASSYQAITRPQSPYRSSVETGRARDESGSARDESGSARDESGSVRDESGTSTLQIAQTTKRIAKCTLRNSASKARRRPPIRGRAPLASPGFPNAPALWGGGAVDRSRNRSPAGAKPASAPPGWPRSPTHAGLQPPR